MIYCSFIDCYRDKIIYLRTGQMKKDKSYEDPYLGADSCC